MRAECPGDEAQPTVWQGEAMSWTRTQTWWQIVVEAVDEIETRRDGVVPWKLRYSEVFPEPHSLLSALRYYWQLVCAAEQHDSSYPGLQLVLLLATPSPNEELPGRAPDRGAMS
jgi:hypothetical protein